MLNTLVESELRYLNPSDMSDYRWRTVENPPVITKFLGLQSAPIHYGSRHWICVQRWRTIKAITGWSVSILISVSLSLILKSFQSWSQNYDTSIRRISQNISSVKLPLFQNSLKATDLMLLYPVSICSDIQQRILECLLCPTYGDCRKLWM